MSTNSTKGTPAYIKWGAGILLVLAFAFAWYVIAEQSDSAKSVKETTEAVVDSTSTAAQDAAAAVTATAQDAASAATDAADSIKAAKVGEFLNEAAQAESVAPYEPNNE